MFSLNYLGGVGGILQLWMVQGPHRNQIGGIKREGLVGADTWAFLLDPDNRWTEVPDVEGVADVLKAMEAEEQRRCQDSGSRVRRR